MKIEIIDPKEPRIVDANFLINIIKKELPYASAGDLMRFIWLRVCNDSTKRI